MHISNKEEEKLGVFLCESFGHFHSTSSVKKNTRCVKGWFISHVLYLHIENLLEKKQKFTVKKKST
jgi:hypothetical protein